MKFRSLGFFFAIVLLLTGASAFGQGVTWSTDVALQAFVGGTSQRPGVSSTIFNGQIWMAYISDTNCGAYGCDVELQSTDNAGLYFGTPQAIPVPQFVSGVAVSYNNPSVATLNGWMYVAWTDAAGTNYIIATQNGTTWTEPFVVSAYPTVYSPTLAVNPANPNELYIGYMSDSTYNPILCAVYPNTSNIEASTQSCNNLYVYESGVTNEPAQMNFQPGLAFYDGQLYASFADRGNTHCLFGFYGNPDTDQFTFWNPLNCGEQTSAAPALAVYGGDLYIAFRTNDSSNKFTIRMSTDGQTLPYREQPGFGMNGPPNLLALNTAVAGNPADLLLLYVYSNDIYYSWGTPQSSGGGGGGGSGGGGGCGATPVIKEGANQEAGAEPLIRCIP